MNKNKKRISIILNILIVIFELCGLYLNFKNNSRISIEFYTEDANVLAFFSSLLLIGYLLFNKKIPDWVKKFKYYTTIGLTITLLVVLFVLIPMGDFNFKLYLFDGVMFFHHTICPILALVSFLFYDDLGKIERSDIIGGLGFTILYSIVLIILNLYDLVKGPYPFLMIKNQTIIASIIWFILIYALAYFIAYYLRVLYTKFNRGK